MSKDFTTLSPILRQSSPALKLCIENGPALKWNAMKRWRYSLTSSFVSLRCQTPRSLRMSMTLLTFVWKSSQDLGSYFTKADFTASCVMMR